MPRDDERTLFYDDDNYRERVGWREIVVVGDRTEIIGDVSDTSVTARATDFPDADENPDLATVEFAFVASDAVGPAELDKTVPGADDGSGGDAFSDLIADADGGIWAMVVALGVRRVPRGPALARTGSRQDGHRGLSRRHQGHEAPGARPGHRRGAVAHARRARARHHHLRRRCPRSPRSGCTRGSRASRR